MTDQGVGFEAGFAPPGVADADRRRGPRRLLGTLLIYAMAMDLSRANRA